MDIETQIDNLLTRYDSLDEPFDNHQIEEDLRKIETGDMDRVPGTPAFRVMAEAMAFGFVENYRGRDTGWGTYYGPMFVLQNKQGEWIEGPSIKNISAEVIAYWENRARTARHPALKLRYADLVWDFKKSVLDEPPAVELAQMVVDESVRLIAEKLYVHETTGIDRLERALSIAISVGDSKRTDMVRDTMIRFEDEIADDSKTGLWGFCFDNLLINKKVRLTDAQKEKLIRDIEERLVRIAEAGARGLDPHGAEAAALRLARYYRNRDEWADVRRVLGLYRDTFLRAAKHASPMVGHAWLKNVYDVYCDFGLRDEADKLAHRVDELGKGAVKEMKVISHKMEISKDELDEYVSELTKGTTEAALARVAVQFVPNAAKVEAQVKELAQHAPLQALITKEIQDTEGRIIATIGSVESDLDGNVVMRMDQNLRIEAIFLRAAMDRLLSTTDRLDEKLVNYLFQSPAFEAEQRTSVVRGVEAYVTGDYLVCAHLLIPQIEHSFRWLLQKSGGVVYKPGRRGGLYLRNLDEILRDPVTAAIFGEKVTKYLTVLLTDQRGWNIRNDISHGIVRGAYIDAGICDRIVHVLLILASVRDKTGDKKQPAQVEVSNQG